LSEFLVLKPSLIHQKIRDTLFGDETLARVVQTPSDLQLTEPWDSFRRARRLVEADDRQAAKQVMYQVLEMPQLESRIRLQAWHVLRELGEKPPQEKEKEMLGVVVEVGMPKGLDLLAAYADHRARYFNYSGAGILWERPDDSLDSAVDDLLTAGSAVVQEIKPWEQVRPPEPTKGNVRINLLTPSGLHIGQGPTEALNLDPMGGPILASSFRLMQKLMELKKKSQDSL
jgi:hypothetical protein